jgi:hypothetical protein
VDLVARPYATAKYAKKQHHHGCKGCRRRYVCACSQPESDGRCNACISGRRSVYTAAWEPQSCCLIDARPCDKYDRDRYLLAGPGPWFTCRTCARTFPCPPEKVRTDVP